ncbi:hypothetical protein C4D60_Mb10t21550 [Musa balbisiana]|uniref:DUF3700 domain-containing protein n=1 Tax=Musa balbisiana TaxID=52838 RepID=A0A4S8IZP0_MUSBA|nr:hypothetical protein C4D60_Mb10t21550 [Musa balbisiana]
MGWWVRSCLQSVLKLVNSMIGLTGMGMILYALWMLRSWYKHMVGTSFGVSGSTPPWFDSLLLISSGPFLFVLSLSFQVFRQDAILDCRLDVCRFAQYMVFVFLFITLEAAITAFIFLNRDWEEDFPEDPTGEFNELKNFVKSNFEMCKWIGLLVVATQALSIFTAMVLRALGPDSGTDCDSDDDSIPARLPLLRNQKHSANSTKEKMLAIFHKTVAHPPQELGCSESTSTVPPMPGYSQRQPKNPDEILRDFHSAHPVHAFCATFSGGAALACLGPRAPPPSLLHRRWFCSFDEVYCMFVGSLDNLSSLVRQYGLCGKSTNEALLVIEAYRTLRDRGPYPADQVVKDLGGSFAFVVYDNKTGAVFAALSSDGGVPLHWGIAADGSVVICDDREIMKGSCGKSYAPFPAGCMFHSEGGLRSFEHPTKKMQAMPRVDSEGMMCGASFKVDAFSKIATMPRVGSAANWTSWDGSY